jgi:hypothetical protein
LLHPTKLINKLNNYVNELYSPLPNGTNIGGGVGERQKNAREEFRIK